jgi:hypothetical protein
LLNAVGILHRSNSQLYSITSSAQLTNPASLGWRRRLFLARIAIKEAWERNGSDMTGPAFATMVSAEVARWRKVVNEAGVKLDQPAQSKLAKAGSSQDRTRRRDCGEPLARLSRTCAAALEALALKRRSHFPKFEQARLKQ